MDLIVLVDRHWGIGCSGEQMVYLKGDLKRFKEMTQGKTVILGRKTLATFPNGKPLPNRRNLILSHNKSLVVEGAQVFSTLEELQNALDPQEEVFVIGGGMVYSALLPYCQCAYVTKVEGSFAVDCFFPDLDTKEDWVLVETSERMEEEGIGYTYAKYKKE